MNRFVSKMSTVVLLLLTVKAVAQTPELKMSLSEALNLAQEKNWEVQKAEYELKQAIQDKNAANAAFLPNVEVSYTAAKTNDPLTAFGFKLQQETVTAADFNPALLNDPEDIENYNAQLQVQQPLINVDAWAARRAAKSKVDALSYKGEYTKAYIEFMVKRAYYGVQLANAQKEVVEKALVAAESAQKLTEDNLKQGYVKDADLMSVKVRVLELKSKLEDAKDAVASAGEFLAFLINKQGNVIVPTDQLEAVSPLIVSDSYSVEQRNDVKSMEKVKDAYLKMSRYEKLKFAPRLNAFGMVNYHDDELLGTDANSWMVGAKLQWSLFSGGKNLSAAKKSKVRYLQAETEYNEYVAKSNMELNKAQRTFTVATIKLEADKMAKEQAAEELRIRFNRYEQGVERTTDLLVAEATAAEKELIYLNTLYNYNMSVFKLELLTKTAN